MMKYFPFGAMITGYTKTVNHKPKGVIKCLATINNEEHRIGHTTIRPMGRHSGRTFTTTKQATSNCVSLVELRDGNSEIMCLNNSHALCCHSS